MQTPPIRSGSSMCSVVLPNSNETMVASSIVATRVTA